MDPLDPPGERATRLLPYMRQLDGLRAVAVAGVFVQHYAWSPTLLRALPWGELGTRLFFVLSGFLITGILMGCRGAVAAGRSVGAELRPFYARRCLRIFPIYYLVLAAMCLTSPTLRHQAIWFGLDLQNVRYALAGGYTGATHLWTLAVEEQFYLAWPWVVLLVPDRWLVRVVIAAAAVGPATRAAAVLTARHGVPFWADVDVLTLSCLDPLALGGLLAVLGASDRRAAERFARASLWAGLPLMVAYLALHATSVAEPVLVVVRNTACGLTFVWVIAAASRGFGGIVGRALAAGPMVYLGRISYGLYLYHFFMINEVRRAAVHLGLPGLTAGWPFVLACSAASIVAATVSWFAIERPINKLKRHFPYERRPSVA